MAHGRTAVHQRRPQTPKVFDKVLVPEITPGNFLGSSPETDFRVPNSICQHAVALRHWEPKVGHEHDARAIAENWELKDLLLELVNQHRERAGVPPVELGHNPAAQIHADHAAAGCHSSHWDEWGLKPQHRYALTGGDQMVSENTFAYGRCPELWDYEAAPALDPEEAVRNAVRQLANSTPHLRNMTGRWHTTMHAGVRVLEKRAVVVQLFGSNRVSWIRPPTIEDGILQLGGIIKNAQYRRNDHPLIALEYHPAPGNLSKGQLARTGCVTADQLAAVILPPPPPGTAYWNPESGQPFRDTTKYHTRSANCRNPYTIPRDVAPPASWRQAKQLHDETNIQHPPNRSRHHAATAITARNLTTGWRGRYFMATADLRQLIKETGPGIYTVVIFARPKDEDAATPVARYPLFVDAAPPPQHPYRTTDSTSGAKP